MCPDKMFLSRRQRKKKRPVNREKIALATLALARAPLYYEKKRKKKRIIASVRVLFGQGEKQGKSLHLQ
jgi:CRISPR/Cas system CSM-associated protein Csm2 small subunit